MVKMAKKLSLEFNRKDISSAGRQLILQAKRRMNSRFVQSENILRWGVKLVDITLVICPNLQLYANKEVTGGKKRVFQTGWTFKILSHFKRYMRYILTPLSHYRL